MQPYIIWPYIWPYSMAIYMVDHTYVRPLAAAVGIYMCGEDCGRRPQWSLAVVAAVVADPITATLLTRHSLSFLFSRPRVIRSQPVRAISLFRSRDIPLLGKMNGSSRRASSQPSLPFSPT